MDGVEPQELCAEPRIGDVEGKELYEFNYSYRSAVAQLFVSVSETDSSRYRTLALPTTSVSPLPPLNSKALIVKGKQPSLEQCSLL